MPRVNRQTVDLSGYPDLVVIYLGMRVNRPRGLKTLMKIGPQIAKAAAAKPEGLLLHESIYWGFAPPHLGMRQYWRDFESLERWTRELPHQAWWKDFLSDPGGTGFWHETYSIRGGIEGVFDDVPKPIGLTALVPAQAARGRMFSSRSRLQGEPSALPPVVPEEA